MYDFTGKIKTDYNSGLIASKNYNSFDVSRIGEEDVLFIGNKGGKIAISLYVDKRGQRLLTWETKEPLEKEKMEPLEGKKPYPDVIRDVETTNAYLQTTAFASSDKNGEVTGILFFTNDGVYHILTKEVTGGTAKKYKIADTYDVELCEGTHALYNIYVNCLTGERINFHLRGSSDNLLLSRSLDSEKALAHYHMSSNNYYQNDTILEEF